MKQADRLLNQIFLGLGSNVDKEKNMALAAGYLRTRFPSLRCSAPVYTSPVDCPGAETFLNQVGMAYTPYAPDEIRSMLKRIESDLHRTPQDKASGRIPIDIDLLQWNDLILKPEDLARPYVVAGIQALLAEETEV